jgi:hypothetical protein
MGVVMHLTGRRTQLWAAALVALLASLGSYAAATAQPGPKETQRPLEVDLLPDPEIQAGGCNGGSFGGGWCQGGFGSCWEAY